MSKNIFQHKGSKLIFAGWTFFIAENLVLSENRQTIIDKFGPKNYHYLYSALSSVACATTIYGYFRYGRKQGPLISNNKLGLLGDSALSRLSIFGMHALGLVGMVQSLPKLQIPFAYVKPEVVVIDDKQEKREGGFRAKCPIDFKAKGLSGDPEYGFKKITRHPMLFSMGLLSLGSALSTKYLSEFVFFGFPLVFAFIGGAHQDHRHLKSGDLTEQVYQNTSLVPFLALIQGRQSWNKLFDEISWVNSSLAVLLASVFAVRREILLRRVVK
eukprot:TRINITY_DN3430_c1_g4_i1.p1 TRINITY_DN3430_c1_g4~~TRINITY_DN3430_c1_g4_i1.p1  ORF type:complete len:271 (-),score=69.42 TRINITY_DN3430_c1_g4_i1:186-998(-)